MTKTSTDWLQGLSDRPMAQHVAWAGELIFAGANESDRAGRTVRFTVVRSSEERGQAHPFAAHTMRRKGFAGTRFIMSLDRFEECQTGPSEFASEVILLGWTDGPKGATATFGLPLDAPTHPFLGCTRPAKGAVPSRWTAVFVELNDEDAPVNQVQRAKVEKPKQKIRNSNLAAQFIKNPNFEQYVIQEHGLTEEDNVDEWLKAACGITSKAELDRDQTAAREFDLIRQDFVRWQEQRGIDTTL